MNGESGVVEPTFVQSPLYADQGVKYFASNVELGPDGVKKINPVGQLSAEEEELLKACLPEYVSPSDLCFMRCSVVFVLLGGRGQSEPNVKVITGGRRADTGVGSRASQRGLVKGDCIRTVSGSAESNWGITTESKGTCADGTGSRRTSRKARTLSTRLKDPSS